MCFDQIHAQFSLLQFFYPSPTTTFSSQVNVLFKYIESIESIVLPVSALMESHVMEHGWVPLRSSIPKES